MSIQTRTLKPCQCGAWAVETKTTPSNLPKRWHGRYAVTTVVGNRMHRTTFRITTGKGELPRTCPEMTTGTFAPGHDARLVSLLQAAVLLNAKVIVHAQESGPTRKGSPVDMADQNLSEALSNKVRTFAESPFTAYFLDQAKKGR